MFNIVIDSGNQEIDDKLAARLFTKLFGLDVVFIDDSDYAHVVITTPSFMSLYADVPLVVLTDDINIYQDNTNVMDIAPFPVTSDDYDRLEFRLIRILDRFKDDNQI